MSEKSGKSPAKLEDLRDLISQAEAARIRGVTRAAIRDLIRRQRLRSIEVGGRELVYRSEVEAFQKDKPGPKSE
jgi:excisionase family DNA binding protein